MSKIDYDLRLIRAFVFDVDGVLSPATVVIGEDGEPQRMTNLRDGFAISKAVESGYRVAVITGGKTENVRLRFRKLGVADRDIYIGVTEKLPLLKEWIAAAGLSPEEVAYMGDDIPDLKCMRYVGLPCAPYDAAKEALMTATFVSRLSGGYGCGRDLIEQVMRARGDWSLDVCPPVQ